jgi:hypothetical protein
MRQFAVYTDLSATTNQPIMIQLPGSERRAALRHPARLAAQFSARLPARTSGVTLYTTNISATGTQLQCPELILNLIHASLDARVMDIVILFPNATQGDIRCKVVYVSDIGGESAIGLEFAEFRDDAQANLNAYLAEHAGPEFAPPAG